MTDVYPFTKRLSVLWPNGERSQGMLTVLARPGETEHQVHGHILGAGNAWPFIGSVSGLHIDAEGAKKPRGRPPSIARDLGILIAYYTMARHGVRLKGSTTQPERVAKNIILDCESFIGLTDIRHVTRSLQKARRYADASAAFFISYSGTKGGAFGEGLCGALFLKGAAAQASPTSRSAHGPAWIWRFGERQAEFHKSVTVTAHLRA